MKTHTFYRKANVSKADAINTIMKRFPTADILKFVEKDANPSEARAAKVRPGSKIYEAKIRVAEFPPSEDKSDESESEAPAEESEEPKEEPAAPESDEGGDSAAPEFGSDVDGLPEEQKMSPEEETNHLLKQILDAISGGGLDKPEDDLLGGPGGPGDLDLPDIGAPGQGEALPPPAGPGGPGGAPLPPPAKPRGVGAPGAFAKFNPDLKSVVLVREGVTSKVTTSSIKAEAEELFPTHKVAKIRRRGAEVINGSKVSLINSGLAVITLAKK